MHDYPLLMENPNTHALFLIIGQRKTGSFEGFILHDEDFNVRRAGHYSDRWTSDLEPMYGSLQINNKTLTPRSNGYPKLVQLHDNDILLATEDHWGIPLTGTRPGSITRYIHSTPYTGTIELFNN